MRRRQVAMLGILLLTIGQLTGCGGTGNGTAAGGMASSAENETGEDGTQQTAASGVFSGELEENVTIQVLENDTAISKGYFAELIDAFNEAYKDQGITAVDANMDQYLDLANDGPYGYGPDVLYQANDVIMQYAEGKHIYPLPVENMECFDKIPQSAWDAYKTEVNGTTYYCGVPENVQSPMLYYRKDQLPENWETQWDDNGNEIPDMVESWNKMYTYSKEVHEADSSRYGYMKSLYDVYFSSGFLFSYGGYVFGENNTDPEDIGFSKGEAEKGAWVLSQLASVMSEECVDDTITTNAYSKLADGTYFATISTPDVYSTFLGELEAEYEREGSSAAEAEEKAKDNLVMTTLPQLPESGDLTEENPTLIDQKMMGGVNGYAVSAYTKNPNASLAFVEFATNYEMSVKRSEMLGVAPAREDAAEQVGGTSEMIYENLAKGNVILMPSIQEVAQIWTPGETFFTDLAKDVFRQESEKKYTDLESLKKGLEDVDVQIHDAIYTLK